MTGSRALDDRTGSPETFLPLKPVVFEILLALGDGDRHGYAILQQIEANSGGVVRLETGPLYRHLKKLLQDGLIEESDRRPGPGEDDERRRYYHLTPLGAGVLAAEARRLAGLVAAAEALDLAGGKAER